MQSQLQFKSSQLELFNDIQARNQYLGEVKQRVIAALGLPVKGSPGTRFEKVILALPDLQLRGTPDNQQTRDSLANRVIVSLKEVVRDKSIIRLTSEAVRIEVGRWSPSVEYLLVASVWY